MLRADRTQTIGQEVFKKFAISGTPTVMILDPDGSEVDWHVGYGPPPETFHARIDRSFRGIETFKYYASRYAGDPKDIDVVFHLARKYGDRYDREKATALYKEVLAIDPEGKKGSTVYNKTRVSYTQNAEFQLASLALYAGNGGPGEFRSFITKYREGELVTSAYQRLASFYSRSSAADSVTRFFEEAVSRYPDDVLLLGSYVEYVNRSKQNVDRGIEIAEKITEVMKYRQDPRHVAALARLYALKGDTSRVDSVYGKEFINEQVSSLSYSLIDYANFWAGQNRNVESALAMAEMSLTLNPENTYLLRQAAGLCSKLNRMDRALELFGPKYVDQNILDASKLSQYASFWAREEKNLGSALVAARTSVELSPATAQYWGVLAMVNEKLKNYDEAIRAGEKAVDLVGEEQKQYYRTRLDSIKQARQSGGKPTEGGK